MVGIRTVFQAMWRDRAGITSVEYAMLTGVVALVVLVAIGQLSGVVSGTMERTADCLDGTLPPSSCD